MDFNSWVAQIAKLGVNLNGIDPNWIAHQYQSGHSPAVVSLAVRQGQAPTLPPVQFQPGQILTYPLPQTRRRKLLNWIGYAAVAFVVCMVLIPMPWSTQNKNHVKPALGPVPSIKEPVEVSCEQLVSDFDKNEVAAQDFYSDRLVTVTGKVLSISNNRMGGDRFAISMISGEDKKMMISEVVFWYDPTQRSKASAMSEDMMVKLTGHFKKQNLSNDIVFEGTEL